MWPSSYPDRLAAWNDLRTRSKILCIDQCLQNINHWWFQSPWRPYSLHWDDQKDWPDPWHLLADQSFCSLARALGIVYTVILTEHEKVHEVELVETDKDNLVLINHGKYILNWYPDEIVNISSVNINIKRTISSKQIRKRLG